MFNLYPTGYILIGTADARLTSNRTKKDTLKHLIERYTHLGRLGASALEFQNGPWRWSGVTVLADSGSYFMLHPATEETKYTFYV